MIHIYDATNLGQDRWSGAAVDHNLFNAEDFWRYVITYRHSLMLSVVAIACPSVLLFLLSNFGLVFHFWILFIYCIVAYLHDRGLTFIFVFKDSDSWKYSWAHAMNRQARRKEQLLCVDSKRIFFFLYYCN